MTPLAPFGLPDDIDAALLALDADDAVTRSAIGAVLLATPPAGSYARQAAVAFESALSLAPADSASHAGLGCALARMARAAASRPGRSRDAGPALRARAEAAFSRALELDPTNREARHHLRRYRRNAAAAPREEERTVSATAVACRSPEEGRSRGSSRERAMCTTQCGGTTRCGGIGDECRQWLRRRRT